MTGRGIPGAVYHPPDYWRCSEPRCRGWLMERAGGRHLHPPGPIPGWLLTEPADTVLPTIQETRP